MHHARVRRSAAAPECGCRPRVVPVAEPTRLRTPAGASTASGFGFIAGGAMTRARVSDRSFCKRRAAADMSEERLALRAGLSGGVKTAAPVRGPWTVRQRCHTPYADHERTSPSLVQVCVRRPGRQPGRRTGRPVPGLFGFRGKAVPSLYPITGTVSTAAQGRPTHPAPPQGLVRTRQPRLKEGGPGGLGHIGRITSWRGS